MPLPLPGDSRLAGLELAVQQTALSSLAPARGNVCELWRRTLRVR